MGQTHEPPLAAPTTVSQDLPGDEDALVLAGRRFRSRLIIGTGKYQDNDQTRRALDASGAEIITVALRRVELRPGQPSLLDAIDRSRYTLLPNTAGCYTADEAVRTCRLARELGMTDFVKLEVIGDQHNLFPDNEATLAAAKILVAEGFTVLPYCIDDPIVCRKLEDLGCAAVMPLGSPLSTTLSSPELVTYDQYAGSATFFPLAGWPGSMPQILK